MSRLGSDNSTSEWKLAGNILEEGTKRTKRKVHKFGNEIDTNSTDYLFVSEVLNNEESDDDEEEQESTRAIVDVEGMSSMLFRNSRCALCGSGVRVRFKSCCIALYCELQCLKPECNWKDSSGRDPLTDFCLPEGLGSPLIERTTDYAVNILYVLSHLSVGDGGREAERHLMFLGLPNSTTMEKSSFSSIEERISP